MFREKSYTLLRLIKINTYTKIRTNLNFKALQQYVTENETAAQDVECVFPQREFVSTCERQHEVTNIHVKHQVI